MRKDEQILLPSRSDQRCYIMAQGCLKCLKYTMCIANFLCFFDCCGVDNVTDWGDKVPESCCKEKCDSSMPQYKDKGCLVKLKTMFEDNFLTTGISVIVLCIIEVLGMCFAMTLFCHISRSGLGYKL
ncbi:tetraspanin-9-like isoform X2 [Lates japonicus]|uniref:Tetraspanin-9-like isoform X2 n=1 Tax=Lates japonicus TaxID=270547 RepID=A0AAD3R294_LATJO|nr:tetraspanin-9-like isoform X2 [Lates japonicus]